MKITYTVPVGNSVGSIGGMSAVQQTVKIAVRNLKRWYSRLRRGTTRVDFNAIQRYPPCDTGTFFIGGSKPTMMLDEEESRNSANENLENELRESLANSTDPETRDIFEDVVSRGSVIAGLEEDTQALVGDLWRAAGDAEDLRDAAEI